MKYEYNNQWLTLNAKVGDTLPIGTIIPYASAKVPSGYLKCNGQAVSRTQYNKLFNAIGTYFGVGDRETTFNVPDLKGRTIIGMGLGIDKNNEYGGSENIGTKLGEYSHTLIIDEMPSHNHTVQRSTDTSSFYVLTGEKFDLSTPQGIKTEETNNTGGGQSHNNTQPSLVVNYIIKAEQSVGIVGNVTNNYSESETDTYSCNYINNKLYKGLGTSYDIDTIKENGTYGILNATGTLPTGYNTNDNNIFIQCLMWGQDCGRQILHDVRTRKTFVRNLNNNHWYAWNEFDETYVLYENASGTTGHITLSDDIKNYSSIEVFFFESGGDRASSLKFRKHWSDYSDTRAIQLSIPIVTNNRFIYRSRQINVLNDTTFELQPSYEVTTTTTGTTFSTSPTGIIKITKVVGYR